MTDDLHQPDDLIAASVALGMDMTPNDDLAERLDAYIFGAEACGDTLKQMADNVLQYAKTVHGLDTSKIDVKPCQ